MHKSHPIQGGRQGKVWPGLMLAGLALLVYSATLASAAPARQSAPARQPAPDGQALFEQKCKTCHTINGGKLVGPDLANVETRRDPAWVKAFIAAPDKMFASGDPVALQLLSEFQIRMPNLGLTPAEVDSLVAYLANPAAGPAAPAPAQPALPAGDPNRGRLAFTGGLSLAGGGPPCLSCHTVAGL
ncbi:MAG TPA: cytochrome c, partial [Anaerolineales bacterium]